MSQIIFYINVMKGVKSKEFGAFWKCMFMVSLCFPNKPDKNNKEHLEKIKNYKIYYDSLQHVIPCFFCRCYIKDVLTKKYPLQYTSRIDLMKSIYTWKYMVSEKLRKQGNYIKPSPPFSVIRKRYEKLYAECDVSVGRCV